MKNPINKRTNKRISNIGQFSFETLEPKRLLAVGIGGNDCAPNLDLASLANQTIVQGQTLTIDLLNSGATVEDLNSDGAASGSNIRFQLDPDRPDDAPLGATITEDGVFTWFPSSSQLGFFEVVVIAVDGGSPALADAEVFTIEVTGATTNNAPNITAIGDQVASVGQELSIDVVASDLDNGDTLTFFLDPDDAPQGAVINQTSNTTATITWTPSANDVGDVEFRVLVTDDGNPPLSDSEAFTVAVSGVADNEAPTILSAPTGNLTSTFSSFDLVFSEAMAVSTFATGNFSLTIVGGANDGQAVPISAVTSANDSTATITLGSDLANGDYRLTIDPSSVTDVAGNQVTGTLIFDFNVTDAVAVSAITPVDGEGDVNVLRETIVRFDGQVDPATVTDQSFYVIARGERIPGRVVVSSTEEFATYFYDSPLPASTRIRVMLDGDQIMGRNGLNLDADGDLLPGGVSVTEFETLPLTRLPGTGVFGFVRDSTTGDPLVGVTIRVDGFPGFEAVTVADDPNTPGVNEAGRFELIDVPAPEFFVTIDGSTVAGLGAGLTYPTLGKSFTSTPGITTQLSDANGPHDIFLPLFPLEDVQVLSSDESTVVGFGAAGQAELAELFPNVDPSLFDGFRVTFEPGSARDDEGNLANQAVVIPVSPNRLPAPLPRGIDPSLIVSVQAGIDGDFNDAGGATNFDVPAQIVLPNLDGLAAGTQTLLFSFAHDAGEWIVSGTATVSEDGLTIVSDPGSGVLAPGWHGTNPGTTSNGPEDVGIPDLPLLSDNQAWERIVDELRKRADAAVEPFRSFINQMANIAEETNRRRLENPDRNFDFLRDVFEKSLAAREQEENSFDVIPWFDITDAATLSEFVSGVAGQAVGLVDSIEDFFSGETTPSLITPDGLTSLGVGYHHFEEHLGPGFEESISQRVDEAIADGRDVNTVLEDVRNQHDELINEIIPEGFRQQSEDGIISPLESAVASFIIPFLAENLREETINQILQDRGLVPSPVLEPFQLRTDASFSSEVDALWESRAIAPQIRGVGGLSVALSDSPTIAVGESRELLIFDRASGDELSVDDSFSFTPLAVNNNITVSDSGVLTANGVNSPWPNIRTPIWVLVQSDSEFGIAQILLKDFDSDSDGIVDSAETRFGLDPNSPTDLSEDIDFDGLSTRAEIILGSNPFSGDSDFDGIGDSVELREAGPLLTSNDLVSSSESIRLQFSIELADSGQQLLSGNFLSSETFPELILPAETDLLIKVTSFDRGVGGEVAFRSAVSGGVTQIPMPLLSSTRQSDSDGDRLTNFAESIFGTSQIATDTDSDGISDFAELEQGLNPLDGIAATTGIQGGVELSSNAEAVTTADDLAFVAIGNGGLSVVDISQFNNPIQLGEVDLPGFASDVAVDSELQLAAIATGSTLQIVDYSDPLLPVILRGVGVGASLVEVAGGLAYAVDGASLRVIELQTGDILQSLTLSGGSATSIAREGSFLYTYQSGSDSLQIIDISRQGEAVVRSSLPVNIASSDVGLFVGNGIAWLSGSGLRTVDVSDPDQPAIINSGDNFFNARRIALNGSGLGVLTPDGGNFVQLYNVRDTNNTDDLLTQFSVTGDARDVVISRGIAYVAAGNRLEVINYQPFDVGGISPTVTISATLEDADPGTAGIQVLEGTTIPILSLVDDDVQASEVELLVNGVVTQQDVSFPFDFFAIAPILAGANSGTVTIQVRATDTGGNEGFSNELTFEIIPDTIAPQIETISPAEGGVRFEGPGSVRVRFSEPLAESSIDAGVFQIVEAGPDAQFGTADDVQLVATIELLDNDTLVNLTTDAFVIGDYRLTIDESMVTDRAGNPLGSTQFESSFVVEERTSLLEGDDVVFVIDVSGSTDDSFGGTPVGDVNGDGRSNTILDAELAGVIALNQELVNLGLGDTANVSLVIFSGFARNIDLDPVASGIQISTTPNADVDGDGVRDIEQALLSIGSGGGTDFDDALIAAIDVFNQLGTVAGDGNLIFLSDGSSNSNITDEIATLEQMGINRLAFGAGAGANLDRLLEIDDRAIRFESTDELLDAFRGLGQANAFASLGSLPLGNQVDDELRDEVFEDDFTRWQQSLLVDVD